MTPEDKKYYEDLFDMYSTDGWKHLMEDLKVHAKYYNSVRNVSDNTPLEFQKGRLDEIDFLLNHEKVMKESYDSILEKSSADL